MEKDENEIVNAYTDCRKTFLKSMIADGRDEKYIQERLNWLDSMYKDSMESYEKVFEEIDSKYDDSDEGCPI